MILVPNDVLYSFISLVFADEEETQVYLGVKRFSSCELKVATDNFSVKNIYRRCGFGKFYN